ncbi:hypothetical protein SAMN05443246_2729 [Paenibacillus sp. GP183]|jgi:hypothetical protein|nr:hypothetical protein SAMN05443246_2729 [Paenibacillus sp. GP183]
MESEPYSRMFHPQFVFINQTFVKGIYAMLDHTSQQTNLSPIIFGNHTDSDLFQQIKRSKERSTSLHNVWAFSQPGKLSMNWEKNPELFQTRPSR